MEDPEPKIVLGEIRAELDALDTRLVGLLKERQDLIRRVIELKQGHGLPPVDVGREEEMLQRIAALAESVGLDPRVATRILRAIIDAFTILEVEALTPPG